MSMDVVSLVRADGSELAKVSVLPGEAASALVVIQSLLRDAEERGLEIFIANQDGCLNTRSYKEDIFWYRDLLAFRYGDDTVSSVIRAELSLLYFTFDAGYARLCNPRWCMYEEIP